MSHSDDPPAESFGTVLGIAPGGVPSYSSDYDSADDKLLPTRQSYRSYVDDIYMGYKWQCVEFCRRWLYVNFGYVFDDVAMAYDIFRLRTVRAIADNRILPIHAFRNGGQRRPQYGCLLVWDEGGEFERTGHVAIVTAVGDDFVQIVEQNYHHALWQDGCDYARELRVELQPDGGYHIVCPDAGSEILGWVVQTDDGDGAEDLKPPSPGLYRVLARLLTPRAGASSQWLDPGNAAEAAYLKKMGGHRLADADVDPNRYYAISERAEAEVRRATNELHALFMHATDYVLADESRLARFNLPRALWPRIQQSWSNRRNELITGRFDFSLSERGLKLYEYNCDSASCHLEAGRLQGKWAQHFGLDEGEDAGAQLGPLLRDAWLHAEVDDTLHIMRDRDLEESYHALYLQESMTAAGIRSKIIKGVDGLSWDSDGGVLDRDGDRIRWVWKTWSWETALDQLRAECEDEDVQVPDPGSVPAHAPRLVDVLLRPDVMVYEPLWTLIPSNKAILPVLWSLFPEIPYLLESRYELTEEMKASGYVAKPIVGRGGANISVYGRDEHLRAETAGAFDNREQIYQQLAPLPNIDGFNVQMNTFSVAGRYAGACTRVDRSLIINMNSDCMPLRVLADSRFDGSR